MKEALYGHTCRFEAALDFACIPLAWVLVGLDNHDAMPEVAAEEKVLSQQTRICLCESCYSGVV